MLLMRDIHSDAVISSYPNHQEHCPCFTGFWASRLPNSTAAYLWKQIDILVGTCIASSPSSITSATTLFGSKSAPSSLAVARSGVAEVSPNSDFGLAWHLVNRRGDFVLNDSGS